MPFLAVTLLLFIGVPSVFARPGPTSLLGKLFGGYPFLHNKGGRSLKQNPDFPDQREGGIAKNDAVQSTNPSEDSSKPASDPSDLDPTLQSDVSKSAEDDSWDEFFTPDPSGNAEERIGSDTTDTNIAGQDSGNVDLQKIDPGSQQENYVTSDSTSGDGGEHREGFFGLAKFLKGRWVEG
eukprot:gene8253-1522_t